MTYPGGATVSTINPFWGWLYVVVPTLTCVVYLNCSTNSQIVGPHDMRGIINSSATTSVCKICSTGTLSISHTKLSKFIAIVDLISSYSELHNMLSFKWMVMYKDHFDNNVTNNFAFSHYNNDICKNSQPKQSKDTSCSVTFKYVIHVVMLSISFHYSCSGREITRRKSEKL